MTRITMFCSLFCSTLVLGCGTEGDDDTTPEQVMPLAGDWSVIATGYSDDDCNAEGFLLPFDSITISDVGTSAFSMTYFLENERIGDSGTICSQVSEDNFECEELAHSTPFSANATITMTALGSVALTSESSITGAGQLVLDCSGTDCGQLASMTSTGSLPCNTTLNFTATAN